MKEQLALLPELGLLHLRLCLLALTVCFLVSVPLGVLSTRSARVERVVVGVASGIQTIPALALLAIMVPVLSLLGAPAIGVLPAFLGLTLYCALPILLATITGLREVSPVLIEAARSVGMRRSEMLRVVQLPLALPFIVAGLRTSAIWCVGMATLATPIGARSLGNFIFAGLQTRNHAATLVGCGAAAVMSLVFDGLIKRVERGLRARHRASLIGGLTGLALLGLLAVGSWASEVAAGSGSAPLKIGTKPFTEQFILGHALAEQIEAKTHAPATVLESLGSTVAFDALARGELDAYVDYSGTLWTTVLEHHEPPPERGVLLAELTEELRRRHGVEVVASLGFENTYCLAMPRSKAEALGVARLSDLSAHADSLAIGGDYEFFARGEWADLKRVYGFAFREQRSMDPALMYQATRAGEVDVISAYSTDARIASFDLAVLTDDRGVIPPYDAVILVRPRLAEERPDVVAALRALDGALPAETMRGLNREVDEAGRTPREVAKSWLNGR